MTSGRSEGFPSDVHPTPGRTDHAPGISTFLEIDLEEGGSLQLTGCSFDPRCDELLGYLLFEDGFESGDVSAWGEAP